MTFFIPIIQASVATVLGLTIGNDLYPNNDPIK